MKLQELADRFHAKVIAHRFAHHYHSDPVQKHRHLNMWKYNFHIFMMLHVFLQRRAYDQATKLQQESGKFTDQEMSA